MSSIESSSECNSKCSSEFPLITSGASGTHSSEDAMSTEPATTVITKPLLKDDQRTVEEVITRVIVAITTEQEMLRLIPLTA